ncbi:MAG TPA: hypothetical protein VHN80_22180 [Kineosporiaceae bacterium]|nr:hypothetical protein [Kineosporiaceae bacterium]
MTTRSTGQPGLEPRKAVNAGIALAIAGVLVPSAASIDPWLLVLVAGLTVFALTFRRSDFDFDFDF